MKVSILFFILFDIFSISNANFVTFTQSATGCDTHIYDYKFDINLGILSSWFFISRCSANLPILPQLIVELPYSRYYGPTMKNLQFR